MNANDTLRVAGFTPDPDGTYWQRFGVGPFYATDDALAFVAAERAREDARLLATLAAGCLASGDSTSPEDAAGAARDTFAALYGRAPSIAPGGEDAERARARITIDPPDDGPDANGRALLRLDGRIVGNVHREQIDDLRAAIAGKVTP